MIIYTNGNLMDSTEDIIMHSVNTLGVMGAGVALAVKRKYPSVYTSYTKVCKKYNSDELLGRTQTIDVGGGKFVCNAFTQKTIGRTGKYTDVNAMRKCLERLHRVAKSEHLTCSIPYGIGCGLGGASWELEVLPLIQDIFSGDVKLNIYKLKL